MRVRACEREREYVLQEMMAGSLPVCDSAWIFVYRCTDGTCTCARMYTISCQGSRGSHA